MITPDNKHDYNRQNIANIFASFYEKLYSQTTEPQQADTTPTDNDANPIPPFTTDELGKAIAQLKNRRSLDI